MVFLSVLLLAVSCTGSQEPQAPNLLFVFSDQHTFDMLNCYGNSQIISPVVESTA